MEHPLAQALNDTIAKDCPRLFAMMSQYGRRLYFPKGILEQSAEAKLHADRFDATIGIATNGKECMYLASAHALVNDMSPNEIYPYAPTNGVAELRREWKTRQLRLNPSLADAFLSLPAVVNGITHGLTIAAELFVDAGDTVLCPDKLWGNYRLLLETKIGANFVTFPLFDPLLRGFNLIAFEEALSRVEGKKVHILLNFPNNPTGYTPTPAEALKIRDILVAFAETGKSVVVICDDAYFGLFYDSSSFRESIFAPLASAHPGILALKVDGCTKEAFMWGMRVGFLTFGIKGATENVYAALEKKVSGCIRADISSCSHISQSILLRTLRSPTVETEFAANLKVLLTRVDASKEAAAKPEYARHWRVYPFNSGYFMCLQLLHCDAEALRLHVLHRYGVGTISSGPKDLRIAFSSVEARDVPEVFALIAKACSELEGKPA